MDTLGNLTTKKYDLNIDYEEPRAMRLIWCFLSAALVITICSRSSFLYAFNLWDDVNSYFTVGKCIFRGFVPYRDLFDQKGIMLYFIYGLASLISPTTFLGVYIMEVIAAFLSLLAVLKIYQLFFRTRIMPYIATPLTGAVIYSAWDFWWGGSAEEFLFPCIMWGMYLTLRHFRRSYPEPMGYGTVLLGGLLAGGVLHIKFSSLGFFFGWMAFVFFADLIGSRAVAKAFVSCLVFLSGMGMATIPWIIYFGVNHAIYDWVYVYIYKNVFEYSKKLALSERLSLFYDMVKNHALNNEVVFLLIFVGVIYFFSAAIISFIGRKSPERKAERLKWVIDLKASELINLGFLFFFLIFVLFIGGVSLPYYAFPLNGFVVFGFIPFCYIIEGLIGKRTGTLALIMACMLSFVITWFSSVNVKSMDLKPQDLYVYKFRDYIVDSGIKDPRIMVQYTFDVGLYTVLDVEPVCYYFQTQTLNMDEVLAYQQKTLHTGEVDFIVTCDAYIDGVDGLYDLVMEDHLQFYEFDHTYFLYQRNSVPVSE